MPLRRKPETVVLLIVLLGTLTVFVVLLADLLLSRQNDLESGERRLQHFSVMMAEHTARTFEAIDILLREIASDLSQNRGDWESWAQTQGWEYLAQRHSRAMPQLRDLVIFDRQGEQRYNSVVYPPQRSNVKDRPYFAALEHGQSVVTFGPYVGRNSGRYTYALARRLQGAGNRFAGVAFASIEPAYLQDFCWYNRLSDDFEALLINAAGKVVASCRPVDLSRQSPILDAPVEEVLFGGRLKGHLPQTGVLHHAGLMVSVSSVPSFADLRIVAAIPAKTLLANWHSRMLELGILGVLLGSILLIGGVLVRRQVREMAELTEQLSAGHEHLEARISEATQRLEAQKNEAERANRAKSRFLAAASHDLRQPLHALSLFSTDLLRQVSHGTTLDLPRLAEQISRSTSVLGELLDSLLDISRLDVAGINPDIHVAPLNPIFERLAASFRRTAVDRGLRLRVRPTRYWVETDLMMLERILVNLLSNALRYTPAGGCVLIAARRRGEQVLIEVRDSGIGIAPEHQAAIFAEFYQVGNVAREQNQGLGLGLSIVDRLTRALSIPVGLKSQVGEGTFFSLRLPLARPQAQEYARPASDALTVGEIWLVGDAPELQQIENLADSWNYLVHCSPDWPETWPPQGSVLITDVARAENIRAELAAHVALVVLQNDANATFSPDVHLLPLPVRPAKLRALLRACAAETNNGV